MTFVSFRSTVLHRNSFNDTLLPDFNSIDIFVVGLVYRRGYCVICINTEIFNKSFEGEVIRRYLSVFSRF